MMRITKTDRLFYASAMEFMIEKLEITRNFARYNGFASFPADEMSDLLIKEIKYWLVSHEGEHWLKTLGYGRLGFDQQLTMSGTLCPVCSGTYSPLDAAICERCGKPVCNPCINIVDHHYHIGWCNCCVQEESLSNLLDNNE
jgi:hypothetical protein